MSTASAQAPLMEEMITRGVPREVTLRGIDEKKRTATFVAATEAGVQTLDGLEYLDMDGLDLDRYLANPTLIDTHDRWTIRSIIGNTTPSVSGRKLVIEAAFSELELGELAWQLVREDFLRAVSIGYRAKAGRIELLGEGESAKLGRKTVRGPGKILRQWELYEITLLSVPADPNALKRSLMERQELAELRKDIKALSGAVERMVSTKEQTMPEEKKNDPAEESQTDTGKETERAAASQPTAAVTVTHATELEIRRRDVYASVPESVRGFADEVLMDPALTRDEVLAKVRAHYAEQRKGAGTPEPVEPSKKGAEQEKSADGVPNVADISDAELVRALTG